MPQTIVSDQDYPTGGSYFPVDNPREDEGLFYSITLAKQGASDWFECINALGDTAYINSTIQGTGQPGNPAGWAYCSILETAVDPGIDTGFNIKIRARFFTAVAEGELDLNIWLVADTLDTGSFFKQCQGFCSYGFNLAGDLAPCFDSSNFVEVDIPLSEAEVQAFRAAGGFAESGIWITTAVTSQDASLVTADFDVSYVALEIPGTTPVEPDLELVQSGGFELSGSGQEPITQSGGYELSGGGEDFYWTNDITQSGGFELSGGGLYGSNEIIQDGGLELSGGGRDFYLVAPDISGIYVLVPGKHYDTWYKRDGLPAETVDVKIPDPFVSLAFIPEDN